MKNTVLALLGLILVIVIVNLLAGLGIIPSLSGGGSGGDVTYEYKVLNAQQMDDIGFRSLAEEKGIEVSEEGQINFPQEMRVDLVKPNLLPRTIHEVEKDGDWTFVSVTSDDHFIFRRAK